MATPRSERHPKRVLRDLRARACVQILVRVTPEEYASMRADGRTYREIVIAGLAKGRD